MLIELLQCRNELDAADSLKLQHSGLTGFFSLVLRSYCIVYCVTGITLNQQLWRLKKINLQQFYFSIVHKVKMQNIHGSDSTTLWWVVIKLCRGVHGLQTTNNLSNLLTLSPTPPWLHIPHTHTLGPNQPYVLQSDFNFWPAALHISCRLHLLPVFRPSAALTSAQTEWMAHKSTCIHHTLSTYDILYTCVHTHIEDQKLDKLVIFKALIIDKLASIKSE